YMLARNASELLPNAELVNPQSSWNDIWIQLIEQEQQDIQQNNQPYKQRIQDIELD
ncbi:MAG: relaxase, partial [Oscillatoriales cyanobacterium]